MGISKIKAGLPLAAAIALIAALVGILWAFQPAAAPPAAPVPAIVTPPGTEAAPEFLGITAWLNSEPLLMAEQRGKVVLVDLWTYS